MTDRIVAMLGASKESRIERTQALGVAFTAFSVVVLALIGSFIA